jgi:C4-dicarboxylate transporter DctM subunit
MFSAITGSNAATTASVGRALHPNLVSENYEEAYSAGMIASGGTVGVIFPPSLLLILYGVTFGVSVSDLFLAGAIPGLLMIGGLVATNTYLSSKRGYGTSSYDMSISNLFTSIWEAKIGIGTIVLLLGGIFAGVFTPSESASIAMLYIIVLGVLLRRLNSVSDIIEPILSAVRLIGVLIPLVVMSIIIQQNLSFLGIRDVIAGTIMNLGSPYLIIPAMVIILLISGSVLASVPNMVLTAPLLAPVAFSLGLSPITWAIVFTMSDAIGFITPPYGLNLYVVSGITNIDYIEVARAALPFLVVLVFIWLTVFLFPEINFLSPDPSSSPLF